MILAFGDNETKEFKLQTKDMQKQLTNQNIEIEFKEISQRNHFTVIFALSDLKSGLFQKISEQMKL